ncbi:hypothetical protein CGLO_17351 [Colletotrichum gloeosporioides Cg-14]|uniref:Uncharacterized protein n=1 Tax=Colletotrichum gloeosporioides (strain Cg-14) TaxID=1237896 RepID=T0KX16_COLGC|nr:hypothetical protein CGLO_17351 [Colletotrichum gloeosporioides Cg-14]
MAAGGFVLKRIVQGLALLFIESSDFNG